MAESWESGPVVLQGRLRVGQPRIPESTYYKWGYLPAPLTIQMVLYTTHPCSKCLLISEDKPEKTLHNNFIEGKKKWGWERLNDFPKDTKILIHKTGIDPRPVFNPKVLSTVNNLLYQYKPWIKLKGKVIEEKNYGSEDSKRPRLRSQPQRGVHLCQPLFPHLQIMKIIIPALKIRHSKIAFTIKFF